MKQLSRQSIANKKWRNKNPTKAKKYRCKYGCKNFILKFATKLDIQWILKLIQIRKQKLSKNKYQAN